MLVTLTLLLATFQQAPAKELSTYLLADDSRSVARSLMNRGEFEDAIARLQQALEVQPDYALCRMELGLCLMELGKFEQAREAFEASIVSRPDLVDAHMGLAFSLAAAGQWELALQRYRAAAHIDLEEHGGRNRAWMWTGIRSIPTSARWAELSEWIEREPELVLPHYLRGVLFSGMGRAEEAERDWMRAAELKKDFALPLLVRALHSAEDQDSKRELLSDAIKLGLTQSTVVNERGLCLFRAKNERAALEDFARAALSGRHPQAAVNHAILLHNQARSDLALRAMSTILRYHGEVSGAWGIAGWNHEEAVKRWKDALMRNPEDAFAWLMQGNAHIESGDAEFAEVSLERALEKSPESQVIQYQLGWALIAKGDSKRAQKVFLKALELDQGAWPVVHAAGIAASMANEHRLAEAYFTRAIELEPTASIPYFRRGLSRTWIEDWDGAALDMSKAARLCESAADAAEAYFQRALIRARSMPQAAYSDLTLSIRVHSTARALIERARVLFRIKQGDHAVGDLVLALRSKHQKGESERALELLEEHGRLHPCDACSNKGLVPCYTCSGTKRMNCEACSSTGREGGQTESAPNSCEQCEGALGCLDCESENGQVVCQDCGALGFIIR
ncbi:MAG: tetratricopeptide (TPR) repeat protein [Planctomycetota bacterium]|jgi:tetratricopeptide (TPR) repeat protein